MKTKTMTHRERVLCALDHRTPDRVPFFYRDVPEVDVKLRQYLGLSTREQLLDYLDIDFRWVQPTYIGPALAKADGTIIKDIWGVPFHYVRFNDTEGYWEAAVHSLAQCETVAELENYPWPQLDWFDFSTIEAQIVEYGEHAIMTAPGYASPGILLPIQNLLGEQRAWTDIIADQEFFQALVDHILAFLVPFTERMLAAGQGRIDFYRIGDDYGGQHGPLFSPQLWREMIKPALHTLAKVAKRYGARYYQHSCGSVRSLIPDFLEIGVDVLDPIQVLAEGMDPVGLKRDFGNVLCFSGGVDEQELLNNGSVEQVRAEVRKLVATIGVDGGYFLGPTHNFQVDIPVENILAMYDEAGKC
jgi:uroporphyrinogen decarboxylase